MKRSRKLKLRVKSRKSRKGAGDRSSFPKQQKEYSDAAKDPSVEARIAEQKAAAEALAQKALDAQAARKAAKAAKSAPPSEEETPGRRDSDVSTASVESEPKVQLQAPNPLWLPKQPGSSNQDKNKIRHFGVQRVVSEKGGRKTRRIHKRKRSHRR